MCLWDILGKAVNRPIYQLLGGAKTRVMAYASSQHLPTVEDFGPNTLKAIGHSRLQYPARRRPVAPTPLRAPAAVGGVEEIRQVRKAVGDISRSSSTGPKFNVS